MKTHAIYYKVADREASLDFYQKALGLKLLREENALAILAGHSKAAPYLIIEESPDWMGNRDVRGTKKHALTGIRAKQEAVVQLYLRQPVGTAYLFKGPSGYAYEVVSPQGDHYLVHSEDDVTLLEAVDGYTGEAVLDEDFQGLESWAYSGVRLHTPQPEASRDFYQKLFGLLAPLTIDCDFAPGEDLLTGSQYIRDIDVISFSVPEVMDLAGLYLAVSELSEDVYLDKKATFLMLKDPSGVELWLSKSPDRY